MRQTDRNRKRTDEAWDSLIERLSTDGLLPMEEGQRVVRDLRQSSWRWIAAAVVVCLSVASLYYWTRSDDSSSSMMVLQNNERSGTLVTTLTDGSLVCLSGNARLHYPRRFAEDRREVTLQGEARFEVIGNSESPFIITTDQVTVEVVGTRFELHTPDDNTDFELLVHSGLVKVTNNRNGQQRLVGAGEMAKLLAGELIVQQQAIASDRQMIVNRVYFKDVRLGSIIELINREYNDYTFTLSPGIENRLITIGFDGETPEMMAEIISLGLSLHYTCENNHIHLSSP